jgi:hypothetical protein
MAGFTRREMAGFDPSTEAEYDTGPIVRQCKFRSSEVTPSTISRRACGHERESSWSKRLQESRQVTFVSPQGLANVSEQRAFDDRAVIEPWTTAARRKHWPAIDAPISRTSSIFFRRTNVYEGELEVRPPGAPPSGRSDAAKACALDQPLGLFRTVV